MPETATAPAVRRVPFDRLGAFPKLFSAYCTDYATVADFYAGDPQRAEARRAAADRAAAFERDRAALADALLDQNAAWTLNGDALDNQTRQHIEALRDPETVATVTGQQVGLLGGPLFTPLKVLSALKEATRLAEETGRTVVPIFWLAGEDHDFEEVAATRLLRRNAPVEVRYDDAPPAGDAARGPAGQVVLNDAIEDVLHTVDETLPPSDFKPALMGKIRAAYQPGTTFLDAFAQLLRALFPETGLVFISPNDARLKRLAAPLFRREITGAETVAQRVHDQSERLEENFHAQVHVRPTNLFLLEDDGRRPLNKDGDAFRLRGTERTFSEKELLELLEEAPERFSPNVLLRPLMQDALLPTAAYVGGPGEVSYFAQYKPAYEWAEIPMPLLQPRLSATLAESKVQKVLDKFGLEVPDFEGDLEVLFQRVVTERMETNVDAAFDAALQPMHEAFNALKAKVQAVDHTLGGTTEAARATLVNEMNALKSRVVKAEKRGQDDVRAQLAKAQDNLFPAGTLQERSLSALYFLNKYGPGLLGDLQEALSLDAAAHQVAAL